MDFRPMAGGLSGWLKNLFAGKKVLVEEQKAPSEKAFFPPESLAGLLEKLRAASRRLQEGPDDREFFADLSPLVNATGCLHLKERHFLKGFRPKREGLHQRGGRIAVLLPGDDPGRTLDASELSFDRDRIMACIEGDGSAWSYLCASLLLREISEFGAFWHALSWSTHTIWAPGKKDPPDSADTSRIGPTPGDQDPHVEIRAENRIAVFFTFSDLWKACLYQHVFKYRPGMYAPTEVEEKAIKEFENAGYTMF
jgi:hypothetical protein